MIDVYIYGRGLGLSFVRRCILDEVVIKAYIDNFSLDEFAEDNIPIINEKAVFDSYEYIIVSIMNYIGIKDELIKNGVSKDKIICFFDHDDSENQLFYTVLDQYKWKTELLWKYQKDVVIPMMNNMYYEINASKLLALHRIPNIVSAEETINLIVKKHISLARFGDGEFEMMLNRDRPRFQKPDARLGRRLEQIIRDDTPELKVAIANNYGDLSEYTDEAAGGIRSYLTPSVRADHMRFLDMNRQYYDAYLSRPYIMYRNKDENVMKSKFSHIKKIWDNRRILIVEGYHTRFGIGNDLISNALEVERIIAPDKNAFSVYDAILDSVNKNGKDKLVLITLGPTATVLAYDLAKLGYWAIDIGQVDIEYEWYLKGVTERCDVDYKTVSEYADKNIYADMTECIKSKYNSQIIEIIKEN